MYILPRRIRRGIRGNDNVTVDSRVENGGGQWAPLRAPFLPPFFSIFVSIEVPSLALWDSSRDRAWDGSVGLKRVVGMLWISPG